MKFELAKLASKYQIVCSSAVFFVGSKVRQGCYDRGDSELLDVLEKLL